MPKKKTFNIFSLLILIVFAFTSGKADSSRVDELQNQIQNKNEEIKNTEAEIEKYQKEISATTQEKQTLQNQIKQLQATASKLRAEINLTQKEIDSAAFTIEKLDIEIQAKNDKINQTKESLAEIIRKMDEEESKTLVEILLANNNLSEFFDNLEQMQYLQKDINSNLNDLKSLKTELENQQREKKSEKEKQEELNTRLTDQKKIADTNTANKNTLLNQTKNKEANYKKILDEKISLRDNFLEELSNLEAQLQIEIDPNSIPKTGSGFLKWPLDDLSLKSCWNGGEGIENCVTQFFGDTPFATQNPQVYGGKGHNGLDFRASIGTPIKSSLAGIITAVGDTDTVRGCYSYGKWVLIDHQNGLSTLYAHLSLVKISAGQQVQTGQLIGYSGQTGFATGPHLHFGVYATQGVKVIRLGEIKTITNCANAILPVADPRAYLNPLSYL